MSSRQKYPRAGAGTPRIRRNGQTFDVDVEALLATTRAHQERRGGSEFQVFNEGSGFDVLSVMAERDSLAYLTVTSMKAVISRAVWRHCSLERAANLMMLLLPAIAEAEILLWHKKIWMLAIGGDGTAAAFENVAYRTEDLPARVQYWGFNRDLTPSATALTEMDLPLNCVNQAFVLFPLPARSTPKEQRPAYLQSLTLSGEREILRDAPSLLPLALYTRNMEGMSVADVRALAPEECLPRYRFFAPICIGEGSLGPYDFLLAGLTFLQQEFVQERVQVLGDRPTRRRLEAAVGTLPAVRTVAFRKAAPASDDPAGERGPYDCHFLVGAHWRKPSPRMLEPRPVFIRPYVKGDTSKPFKPPQETVKVVKR